MKRAKLVLLSLILSFGMFFVSACKEEQPVLAEGIFVSEVSVELTVGDYQTIDVNIVPENVSKKDFTVNMLTEGVVTIDYDKQNMQFTINASNEITNGFDTVELEVKTVDGTNLTSHISVKINKRTTPVSDPKNLHYENGQLVWSEVLGDIKGYQVNINGQDMPLVYTNSYAIDASLVGQEITARVYAVAEDDSLSSGYAEYVFKILGAPTNLDYNNGTIVWDAVEGASSYNLYFDGKVENTNYTQLDISDRFSEAKTYQIKVMAVGDEQNNTEDSKFCESIEITKLEVPQNIHITNGVLYWQQVQNISCYTIYLDENEPFDTTKSQFNLPQELSAGQHFVRVKACGDNKNYLASEISPNYDFEKLQKINRLYVENGMICWDANLNATSYVLLVNGVAYQTTNIETTSVDFSDYNSGSYLLNVKGVGNGGNILDSDLMDESFEVTKLATPTNLHLETINNNNYIVWDAVQNASSYSIIINDEEPILINDNKYMLDVGSGTYKVTVQALGDSTKYISSNKSNMFSTTKLENTQNLTVKNGEIVWDRVLGVGKYQVLIDGEQVVETTNNKFTLQSTADITYQAKTYEISVRPIAATNSNISGDFCDSIMVTKLAVPTVKVLYGELVDAVMDNAIIEYTISTISESGSVINTYKKQTLAQLGGETYQRYSITAQALAQNEDGSEALYVNGDSSTALICIQLPKVTNIYFNNGILYFDEDSYSDLTEGYTFDLKITDVLSEDETTNTQNITRQPSQKQYDVANFNASQYSLNITVIPNYNENGESISEIPLLKSKTSSDKEFTVLGAPNNVKISSLADEYDSIANLSSAISKLNSNPTGLLVWEKVAGATQYSIKIDGVEKLITMSNECDLIGLLADDGSTHSITIQAIGNGSNIVSGTYSSSLQCQKLNRPTNLQCDGTSIYWDSEYNNFSSLFDLTSSSANIVIFVAEINSQKFVTLNFNNLSTANLASRLSEKSYNLPQLKSGEYVTRIYAIPLNAYLSMSGEINETTGTHYVLSEYNTNELNLVSLLSPVSLSMREENEEQILSWGKLLYENNEVDKYVVLVEKDQNIEKFEVDYTENQWKFSDYTPGTYFFAVYAKATSGTYFEKNGKKYYYINSVYSNVVQSVVMENPELFVDKGQVSWTIIDGVDKYVLTYGKSGEVQKTFEFGASQTKLVLGSEYDAGDYTFKIMARGDGSNYISSKFSLTSTFTKLTEVVNVRLENGVIKYDEHSIVSKDDNDCYYAVSVNGKNVSNNKLLATELEGYASSAYSVCAYAYGDNSIYLTSNASNEISVIKLSTPTSLALNSGILSWTKSNNASSYQLDISGSQVSDIMGVTYAFENLPCGDYVVRVKAIGNSTSYLNSDWTKTITISKLDEIKNLRVENGVVTWDSVSGTNNDIRLKIKLHSDNEYTEIRISSDATTYVLDDTYQAGTYDICMYNSGGTYAISSSVTSVLTVTKLTSPQNLRITTEAAEQFIQFDAVQYAGSYKLKITYVSDGENISKELPITNTKIATSLLAENGISIQTSGTYTICVMSNGTNTEYLNSDYSSVLTITKPEAPVLTDVKTDTGMSSGLVAWEEIETADYYRVIIEKDGIVTDEFTTEETHIYLSNKANYTIYVTACKDLNGFDSETSSISLSYALYDGSGTEEDPYRLKTATDFNNIKYNPFAYYQMVNDIDFSTTTLISISSESNRFEGTIDGNNYAITGVSITSYSELVALVPVLGTSGSIKNMTLEIYVTSGQQVAGFVAINYGTIENCVVNGNIAPIYNVDTAVLKVGGIASKNNGSVIKCINNAIINPQNTMNITYAGGIVAENEGTVSGCGNNSQVSATYAGGIVALSKGNVRYCYNNTDAVVAATSYSGRSTCSGYAGGIIGYASSATDSATLDTCYNVGQVVCNSQYNAIYPYAGGLIGYNNGYKITNCYSTSANNSGNITIYVTTNNNGKGYAGILVGYNEKGTIAQNNVSIYQNSTQVDAFTSGGFVNKTRFAYTEIDEITIINILSGYDEVEGLYPTIKDNAKY